MQRPLCFSPKSVSKGIVDQTTEMGFEAIPIIHPSINKPGRGLRRALDLGIAFYDTAHLYLDNEEKIGGDFTWVLLATKTMKRDRLGLRGI